MIYLYVLKCNHPYISQDVLYVNRVLYNDVIYLNRILLKTDSTYSLSVDPFRFYKFVTHHISKMMMFACSIRIRQLLLVE